MTQLPTPLPILFVPHGAPTFALNPGAAGAALATMARRLPRPRAILIVSAHWATVAPTVGTAARNRTVHDFGGFPDDLYAIDYPAAGDAGLAARIASLLSAAGDIGVPVIDDRHGLDHGAWIPLRLMYPRADIPVVALSLQPALGSGHHFRLGQALASLPADGILIIASGNLTHNLRDYQQTRNDELTPSYVRAFADWVWNRLQAGDVDALLDYRAIAPAAARAHPSEEHLLPIHFALGAAGSDWHAERLHASVTDRVLAMDSFALWPGHPGAALIDPLAGESACPPPATP